MALYTQAERQRRWRKKHPDKTRAWGRLSVLKSRLRKLGRTIEDYNRAVQDLNGVCPGCLQPNTHKLGWMLDHDHITGVFRGLLCGHCNSTLGHAHDDPATLRRLADYLEAPHVS